MEKELVYEKVGIVQLHCQELKCTIGGTTCPGMGDYYSAGYSSVYLGRFIKGVFKGVISYF